MKCGSSLFFSPWVGNKYNQGISGKKILVLGASHYCNHKGDCCYFFDCTNEHLKDSSLFDKKCPYTDNEGGGLLQQTVQEVEAFLDGYSVNNTYSMFTDFMVETMGLARDMQSFWSSIVYMNYVQFMLPHMRTENWDISERDYEAFCSVVQCYEPMVVIVWGTPVGNELKKRGQGNTLLPGADINYLFKQQISGKNYLFVNCYHPSNLYGVFMNDTDYFAKQLQIALDSV